MAWEKTSLSIGDSCLFANVTVRTTDTHGIFGFFVTSRGFGLIEQAGHRAANQVNHGDEVGLVPVAAGA